MRTTACLLTGTALVIASIGIGAQATLAGDFGTLEIHPPTAPASTSPTSSMTPCP